MFFENPSITKSDKQRSIINHTISDVPGAAVKTFFAEQQSKGLIAVINPVVEDGYCMLAGVSHCCS
jgi:hypothetical protein